ncbi:AsmA-like C-terminal domain-containing protein [Pelovirga terrestris]|uniref:AsmA-like C-terminal domain-containing protein n=1 Tax=Pelovirga terrestris TaxID=2771352 RepID=A0A8J6QVA1_9BACT|nr:AsmA-like C-terminal domain-containing protein [Pelovirga terrestris]MBD1401450.1 AsmA-like C-terminal domain-containing protein [Pelovirga terrestris]
MMRSIITTATRVIITLLLIGLLAIALLLLYVSRLELEEYRHALEEQISSVLQQPVRIGSGSLKFRQGLAIELYQVEIGTEQEFHLMIPQIRATLPLRPLLNRQVILKNVEILGAKTALHLPLKQQLPPASTTINQDHPFELDIRMLTVRHAEVRIYDRGESLVHLANLHAVIYDWQAQRPSQLVISGHEMQTQADFLLETMLPPFTGDNWRQLNWEADLQIGRHRSDIEVTDIQTALAQSGRIKLTLDGVPAEGVQVSTTVTRAGSSIPLIHVDGIWTSTREAEILEQLDGTLLGFPARGYVSLQHTPARQLSALLESCNLTVTSADLAAINHMTQAGIVSGLLEHLRLRIDHQWPESDEHTVPLQVNGQVKISDISWKDPAPWSIGAIESEWNFHNSTLTLDATRIHTELGSLQIDGLIDQLFTEPFLRLEAIATPLVEDLLTGLNLPEGWSASGPAQLAMGIKGTLDAPAFTLSATLDDSRIVLDSYYSKEIPQPARVTISGKLHHHDSIEIDHFTVNLKPVNISGKARIRPWDKVPSVALTTDDLDLSSLSSINRTFRRLQLTGKASADLFLDDTSWNGKLLLTEGGAHLTTLIGDLNSVSGEVEIDRHGLRFNQLPAKLGDSAFMVNGDMQGWSDPALKLEVAASSARAQDLVFRNPDLTLHNLLGRLEIDQHGISFEPVTVTLEGSTQASVFGRVTNFSQPQTNLVIHGEKANVLDIVNLFRGPPRTSPESTPDDSPQEPIIIQISAREGNLGGMKFSNARTTLIDHKGVLSIYPLTFESRGGWVRAKVEYNRHDLAAPLKISGHLNGVDASIVHHDLFDRPGLIRGPLTGDFYLEGDPGGDTFWEHAGGGAYFQIHQGTLRKFRGLAQIFSLLNVSQIFSGRLPDMDREGMPFTLMEGSVQLSNGLVYSEDFKIISEAMNMSIVGQHDLKNETLDLILGVMPLRTVDKVVSSIPIAGWLLAGEDRAVLTAYFHVEGPAENPSVSAIPINTISNTVLGVFKRTFGLPEKLIRDFGSLFQPEAAKKEEAE